jgi:MFS family permease
MNTASTNHSKNLWLASLGAMLEYYDFVVYIYLATKISVAFFPAGGSDVLKLTQTLAIYSIGFVIRPFAGLIMSHYADKLGRKKLFIFTVTLMSVATLLIGLLPTYNSVGWIAPIALLFLRILQGCAVGGELPSAAVFVTEHSKVNRIGFSSGVLQSMAYGGFLLGASAALAADAFSKVFPEYPSLAWRLPFIVGGALGIVSAYLRRALEETPLFEEMKNRSAGSITPLKSVFRDHRSALVLGFGLIFAMTITNFVYFQYFPTFLESQLKHSHSHALTVSMTAIWAMMVAAPLWGMVSDRLGWATSIGIGALLLTVLSTWLFNTVPQLPVNSMDLVWSIIPVAMASGAIVAPVPGLLSSIFPTAMRQSGYAVPYNIGVALFGGPLPLILVWLVSTYGLHAPLYVLLLSYVVVLLVSLKINKTVFYLGPNVDRRSEMGIEGRAAATTR